MSYSQDPYHWGVTHKMGDLSQLLKFFPTPGSLPACYRKCAPRTSGFEGQQGLHMGKLEGYRRDRLCFSRAFIKILHIPSPSTDAVIWKKAWFRHMCWSWRDSQREREAPGTSARHRRYGIHLGELVLWGGGWCWWLPFWSLPPSLLATVSYLPTSRLASNLESSGLCSPAPPMSRLADTE